MLRGRRPYLAEVAAPSAGFMAAVVIQRLLQQARLGFLGHQAIQLVDDVGAVVAHGASDRTIQFVHQAPPLADVARAAVRTFLFESAEALDELPGDGIIGREKPHELHEPMSGGVADRCSTLQLSISALDSGVASTLVRNALNTTRFAMIA